jgi:hypothetical protein
MPSIQSRFIKPVEIERRKDLVSPILGPTASHLKIVPIIDQSSNTEVVFSSSVEKKKEQSLKVRSSSAISLDPNAIQNMMSLLSCFVQEEACIDRFTSRHYMVYLANANLEALDLKKLYDVCCLFKIAITDATAYKNVLEKELALQCVLFITFKLLHAESLLGIKEKELFLDTLPLIPSYLKNRGEVKWLMLEETKAFSQKSVLKSFFTAVNKEVLERIYETSVATPSANHFECG